MAGYQFTKAVLYPHTNCLIVANDSPTSQNLYAMSTFFYDNLDPAVRPMRRYYNTSKLVFDNPDEKARIKQPGLNSRIVVESAHKPDVGRSFAFQSVHMSEFAFWKSPGDTFDSIMGTMPKQDPDSFAVIESTPNGAGGDFYDMWKHYSLLRGTGDWLPIFVPFWLDPHYKLPLTQNQKQEILDTMDVDEERYVRRFKLTPEQLAWRRWCIANDCRGSVEKFNQEYAPSAEECFLVKGDSVFHKESLRYYMNRTKPGTKGRLERRPDGSVVFNENGVGPLTVWAHPNPAAQYAIGVDAAWGLAHGDYSAAVVMKAGDKPVQVAEFHEKTPPQEFAEQMTLLGLHYNKALIMPESTGTGAAFVFALKDKYPNLGTWERLSTRGKVQTNNIGWDQNKRSQQVMRGEMTSLIYERSVEIFSENLVREMSTYVYKTDLDSMEAAPGANDDLVIAFGLALMALKQIPSKRLSISFAPDDEPIMSSGLWTPSGITAAADFGRDDWMMQ